MSNVSDVTKFVRYSADVETITEAWSFVMEKMDEFPYPTIQVQRQRSQQEGSDEWVEGYDATIYGDVAV